MNTFKSLTTALWLGIGCLPIFADRVLDIEEADKLEIHHSMLGYRSTLVFFSFTQARAVLVLTVHNQDERFPVSGAVHLFDPGTPLDGLKKWMNNQHSDALFADAPVPDVTVELPEGVCRMTSYQQSGQSQNPGPDKQMFKEFQVKLSCQAYSVDSQFTLSGFTETVRVYVKTKHGGPDER